MARRIYENNVLKCYSCGQSVVENTIPGYEFTNCGCQCNLAAVGGGRQLTGPECSLLITE